MSMKFHSAAMAQQWEIAKGHLRALAALAGCYSAMPRGATNYDAIQNLKRYEETREAIEKFIADFTDRGLHEGKIVHKMPTSREMRDATNARLDAGLPLGANHTPKHIGEKYCGGRTCMPGKGGNCVACGENDDS